MGSKRFSVETNDSLLALLAVMMSSNDRLREHGVRGGLGRGAEAVWCHTSCLIPWNRLLNGHALQSHIIRQ